ncbi:MAG TPA: hypothetical protein VFW85_03920 [Gaiellaceae bacterium]|nr:hypothetical protein [Gaiellaceae bacterium]
MLRLIMVGVLAVVACMAASARAQADGSLLGGNCGSVAPVFAPWGDSASYYFPANGGFESGASGWSLSGGAAVVDGNEPFYLHNGGDSHALLIPAGGSATTSVCFGVLYPALRFVAEGSGARIRVSVSAKNLLGFASTLDGGTFTAGSSWAPSPKLSSLLSAVTSPLGAKSMQVTISVSGASAQVDDLYIDPFALKR